MCLASVASYQHRDHPKIFNRCPITERASWCYLRGCGNSSMVDSSFRLPHPGLRSIFSSLNKAFYAMESLGNTLHVALLYVSATLLWDRQLLKLSRFPLVFLCCPSKNARRNWSTGEGSRLPPPPGYFRIMFSFPSSLSSTVSMYTKKGLSGVRGGGRYKRPSPSYFAI